MRQKEMELCASGHRPPTKRGIPTCTMAESASASIWGI